MLTFHELEPHFSSQNDTTYIVNFWASWCKPCVEELPELERFQEENESWKVSLLLVSLDMPSQINTKLIPFLHEHNITAPVVVLDDPDFNSWIDKVDPEWSGTIPATMIFRKDKRMFFEQSMTYDDLNKIVFSNFVTP